MTSQPMKPATPDNPAPPDSPTAPQPPDQRPWPVWYALVTAWLLPATTTRRMAGVSLASAYVFHLATVVATAALFGLGFAWTVFVYDKPYGTRFLDVIGEGAHEAWRFADSQPAVAVGIVVGVPVGIELLFLALAMLMMPFGARVELTIDSIRHALRRTWLHTGHLLPLILLPWLIFMAMEHATREWEIARWAEMQQPLTPPDAPADPTSAAQVMEYNRALKEFQRNLDDRSEKCRIPWYARYGPEIGVWSLLASCLWFCWALFRGILAQRPTPDLDPSPICRECGYSLMGLSRIHQCPECGRQPSDFLGRTSGSGTPWQQRSIVGGWKAFWRTTKLGLHDPRGLAMGLSLKWNGRDHLWFLLIHILIATVVLVVLEIVELILHYPPWIPGRFLTIRLTILYCGFAAVLFAHASLGTLVLASVYRLRDGRSVMSGIAQAVCYSSGVFTLAAIIRGTAWCWGQYLSGFWWRYWQDWWTDAIVWLICMVVYVRLIRRGASGIRYATE